MTGKENDGLADIGGTLEGILKELLQKALLSETVAKEDFVTVLNIAKVAVDELKDLTLRYVRRMRLMPYPDHDYNSYPFVCQVIVQELFAYSQEHPEEEVKIFTGDIKSEFYGDSWLLERIDELAGKGIKFDIILAKPPTGDCLSKWQLLMAGHPGAVNVRAHQKYNNKLRHLMLVGDSYRIEAPHQDYEGPVNEVRPLRPARYGFHERSFTESDVLSHWENEVTSADFQSIPGI